VRTVVLALLLLVTLPAFADAPPGKLLPGLGEHHHAIATRSPEAQAFFDQGLRLCLAFNAESLRPQKRDGDAAWVRGQFEAAWREADGPLAREDL